LNEAIARGARYQNLIGKRYGRLVILKDVGRKFGCVLWHCKCDCGNEIDVTSMALGCGETRSCGCLQREVIGRLRSRDLYGQRFNRLTVFARADRIGRNGIIWKCRCDCDVETEVAAKDLLSGHTKSCGCLQREKARCNARERSKSMRGPLHPCWKGGINRDYPLEFTGPFRTKIRKRDGFACRVCGKWGYGLDVHHIDENKNNCLELNLVTLCRSCHKKVHHGSVKIGV
jgi:hypothetical protein